MIHFKYFLLLIIFLKVQMLFSQRKPIIVNPVSKVMHWEAVINKADITVYRDRYLTDEIPYIKLPFKQSFFVVDYKTDDNSEVSAVQITLSKFSEEYYWLNPGDLLLTNSCLREKSIPVKAMVVNYSKNEKPTSDYFGSPNLNDRLGKVTWPNVYFVFATYPANVDPAEAEYLLLGTNDQFNSTIEELNAENTILGWFRNGVLENLVIWKTRIGFQPNLSVSSKQEKMASGVYASVLSSVPDAMRWATGSKLSPKRVIFDDSLQVNSSYQWKPMDFRMPVTDIRKVKDHVVYSVACIRGPEFGQKQSSIDQFQAENEKGLYLIKGFLVNEQVSLNKSTPFEPVILLSTEDCYRLLKVTEDFIRILSATDPGDISSLINALQQYGINQQLFPDFRQIESFNTEIPVVSQFIGDFRSDGISYLQRKSRSEIHQMNKRLIHKREVLKQYYNQLVYRKGIKIGLEYYQWVKLSDLP